MQSNLGALIDRLEQQVKAAEGTVPKTPEWQMYQMNLLLDRLEKATGFGAKIDEDTTAQAAIVRSASQVGIQPVKDVPVAPKPPAGVVVNFDAMFKEKCFGKIDALLECCKELGNEGVTESVNLYLEIYKSQSAVFNTMATCAKPENAQIMVNIARDKKNQMIALEKKNRKFMNHIRCVEDSLNLFAWFMIPTEDTESYMAQLADFYSTIDFMGGKLSEDLDKKWYKSFREVQKDFYELIKNNYPTVMTWSGTNTDVQAQYEGFIGGKIEAPTPQKAEADKPKPAPAKKAAAAPAKVPKEPVKKLKFNTWEVSNFVDAEIVFEEDDVDPSKTFNFFNCEKLKVTIPDKFKNFMIQRCKRMELNVQACVSMGEIIKSERITLEVEKTVPQVSVELSNGVQVVGTLDSKKKISIMTTASQSVSFKFPKDPGTFDPNNEEHDPTKVEVIPESFCSKFVDDKFMTIAEEGGFD